MKENIKMSIPGFNSVEIMGVTQIEVKKDTPMGETILFKKENDNPNPKGVRIVLYADKVEMQQEGAPEKDVFS